MTCASRDALPGRPALPRRWYLRGVSCRSFDTRVASLRRLRLMDPLLRGRPSAMQGHFRPETIEAVRRSTLSGDVSESKVSACKRASFTAEYTGWSRLVQSAVKCRPSAIRECVIRPITSVDNCVPKWRPGSQSDRKVLDSPWPAAIICAPKTGCEAGWVLLSLD